MAAFSQQQLQQLGDIIAQHLAPINQKLTLFKQELNLINQKLNLVVEQSVHQNIGQLVALEWSVAVDVVGTRTFKSSDACFPLFVHLLKIHQNYWSFNWCTIDLGSQKPQEQQVCAQHECGACKLGVVV